MVSSPSAPDPAETAAAQTSSNLITSESQAGLNNVNQSTPLGQINYTYGTQDINGQQVPQTNSNVTLNPTVQNALNSNLSTTANEADTANSYLNQVNSALQTPYNTSNAGPAPTPNAAYQQNIMNTQNQLQQPYIDRSNEQLQASLAAQGITPGSEAYKNAQMDQNNSLNNLQEQNTLNATQQEQSQFSMDQSAYQQKLSNYNQNYTMPLNEFSALQSGSQVQQPQFSAPAQETVAPTNVASIYQNAYNQKAGNANSTNSGLFGLGGSALGAYGSYAGMAALAAA